jgi:hypothetical protein
VPEELPRSVPDVARPPAVFIFGVTQRSGTHYLYDLLIQHPQCRPALSSTSWEGSWEDNLLRFGEHLEAYVHDIGASNRLNPEGSERRLLGALGRGLVEHLRSLDSAVPTGDTRTVVTKTPMMKNLQLMPELLPGVPAVLLVRDPRAVVASAVRTFGRSVDEWALSWRSGAREALAFERKEPGVATIIRYEDLYSSPRQSLTDLLLRLGLDPDAYDFGAAQALPVRGSSQLGGEPRRITWDPQPRGPEFDPLDRGAELDRFAVERLRWLAEPEMRAFGYWRPEERRPAGLRRPVHVAADVHRRGRTALRLLSSRLAERARAVRGSATAP